MISFSFYIFLFWEINKQNKKIKRGYNREWLTRRRPTRLTLVRTALSTSFCSNRKYGASWWSTWCFWCAFWRSWCPVMSCPCFIADGASPHWCKHIFFINKAFQNDLKIKFSAKKLRTKAAQRFFKRRWSPRIYQRTTRAFQCWKVALKTTTVFINNFQ